jgi:hypothetical protein
MQSRRDTTCDRELDEYPKPIFRYFGRAFKRRMLRS